MNKKRTAKVALATFGLSVLMPTAAMSATDIQGHWAGSVLEKWETQALISGYEDGTIRPDHQISRAEFVSLVNRVAGYQAASNAVNFSDVASDDWFASQVAVAVNEGYIGGFEDNTFRPADSVTRAQAAAIIARIKNLPADAARADEFADAAVVPAWAKGVVGAVANAGYMIGDSANHFNADKALTRAEAVASLDRVFGVKDAAAQTVTLSAAEGVILKGASKTITATSSVENAVITAVSSNTDVATVTVDGSKVTIKGLEKGVATITVTAEADGYKTATATYNVTVAIGGGGGGGSSSGGGGGSSDKVVVTVPEDNIIVPDSVTVDKDDIKIVTTVDKYAESGSEDAVTKVALPENVEVASVTLPTGTEFTVNGVTVKLTGDIQRAAAGNITVADVLDVIDSNSDAAKELEEMQLDENTVLVACEQVGTDELHWTIAGMTAAEQQAIFQQMQIALKAKN